MNDPDAGLLRCSPTQLEFKSELSGPTLRGNLAEKSWNAVTPVVSCKSRISRNPRITQPESRRPRMKLLGYIEGTVSRGIYTRCRDRELTFAYMMWSWARNCQQLWELETQQFTDFFFVLPFLSLPVLGRIAESTVFCSIIYHPQFLIFETAALHSHVCSSAHQLDW